MLESERGVIITRFWVFSFFALAALSAILTVAAFREKARLFRRLGDPMVLRRLLDPFTFRRQVVKALLVHGALVAVIFALAGPRWGRHFELAKRRGLDVIVAIDVSDSMLAEDIKPNRLARAKSELGFFLQQLSGDRIGLIAFAGSAFLQCPLTLDYGAAQSLLELIDTDLIPARGTSLADAIELASESYPPGRKHRALVLLTDGEDHSGKLPEAVQRATEENVQVFVIGFGRSEGEIIPLRDETGSLRDYKKDKTGQTVVSRLDEKSLVDLASKTGGRYYRASEGEIETDRLLKDLRSLERKVLESRLYEQFADRYRWPLWVVLILLLLEFLWPETGGHIRWCLGKARRGIRGSRTRIFRTAQTAALALLIWPSTAEAMGRADRGRRAYARKDYGEAVENFQKAAEQSPSDPAPRFNLGNAHYRQGNFPAAQAAFEEVQAAAREAGLAPRAAYNSGNALFRQKNFEQAVEKYKQALRLDPADQDAKHNLEMAKAQLRAAPKDQKEKAEKQRGGPEKDQPSERTPQKKPSERPDQMSKEDAERLLQAVQYQEKAARKDALRVPAAPSSSREDW